ncbi:uncharacterized protein LOC135487547 [Lineus longissimus]|uniref:uncharacterized protein LOC135487547 n=1 Tax=Lineus longissimus TaxID=88925 RepID=UPI002B4D13AE
MEAFLTSKKLHRYKTTYRLHKLPISLTNQSEKDVPKFIAISDTNDTLRISSENTTESILKFPEPIFSAAVSPEGIFVATESGDILRIPDAKLKDYFRCSSQIPAAAADHDIFSSLLADDLSTEFEETVKTICYGATNVVLKCPGVRLIHSAGGYLIVVCLCEDIWSVLAYNLSDFDAEMKKRVDSNPVLSRSINAGGGCDRMTRPVVSVVKPFDENPNVISDCLHLNQILYNQLFGYGDNLLDLPVILLGLPSGHVYSLPMNGTSDFSMLYQCQESVVGIHGMVLEEPDTRSRDLLELSFGQKESHLDSGATTLVLTCGDGNICLIHGSPSSKEPVYLHKYLPGPLVATAVSDSSLVLSTWRNLYHVEIKLKNSDGDQFVVESEKTRLGFGHMTDVLLDDAKGPLFTINNKGKIFKISLGDPKATLTGQPRQAVYGEQMKQLLSKITKISGKLLEESKKSETLDKILAQLNLATSIQLENSVEKLTCGNCAQHQTTRQTINWSLKVLNISQGLYCGYSLQVNLENSSNILLESGWELAVSLVSVDELPCAKSCETDSFILPELQPSHKHSINIPMNSKSVSNLSLTVRTSLLWKPTVPKCDARTVGRYLPLVSVSLIPIDLNILDFCSRKRTGEQSILLHVEPSLHEQLKTLSESHPSVNMLGVEPSLHEQLKTLSESHPSVNMLGVEPSLHEGLKALSAIHPSVNMLGVSPSGSMSVIQASEARVTPKSAASSAQNGWTSSFMVDGRGRCDKCFEQDGISREACLLNQLLQLDTNTLPNVRLVTPRGDSFSIVVESAKGGRLKVVLQGPTMVTVQDIEQALRSRLVRDSSQSSLNPGAYNRRHMNHVLQEYEVLRKELQSLTIQLKRSITPSPELLENVVGIHQRLRDINVDML